MCEFAEQVDIARDQAILGNDSDRVAKPREHFQASSGNPQPPFDRLIRIGYAAHGDHLGIPFSRGELVVQQLRRVHFYHNSRFKIRARRKPKVFVRRTRVTINAAVFAAAIRIEARLKANVGTVVARDNGLR